MLFAPQINVIFGISTSNNAGEANFMHEAHGGPLLQIYQIFDACNFFPSSFKLIRGTLPPK